VNVLQALVLTENGKTITTPTYHVFDLYQVHQGAQALRTLIDAPALSYTYAGPERVPAVPASSSTGERSLFGLAGSASLRDRTVTLTVVNPHIGEPVEAAVRLYGDADVVEAHETVLTHDDIHALNDFDTPDTVRLSETRSLQVAGKTFSHTFAPQSVTRLDLVLR
jgi:alpha-N-arabinofuranosidase